MDAKNNLIYFNQHNNDGYDDEKKGLRVCPYCHTKNFGNSFEKCSNCNAVMSIFFCEKCKSEISGPTERCKCGYSLIDDIKYNCIICERTLNTSSERCECGYTLDNPAHKCSSCGIINAGYEKWKDFNPYYKLILNENIIFEGYKHQCIDFISDNLIASKQSVHIKKMFKGEPFIPTRKGSIYINCLEYSGLTAVLYE